MKLSIFQIAQAAAWYRNFEANNDPVSHLIELGNLAGLIDSILPDHSPRPSDMEPGPFVELVAGMIPKLLQDNIASLTEFGESGKKFIAALESGMKALKSA